MRQGRRADGHSHASSADMGDDGCSRRSGEASTEAFLNQGDFPGLNRCGDSALRRGSRTHPMARYESRGRNIRRAGRTRPTELTLGNRATTARTGCCEPRRAWNPADGVGRRLWTGATAGGGGSRRGSWRRELHRNSVAQCARGGNRGAVRSQRRRDGSSGSPSGPRNLWNLAWWSLDAGNSEDGPNQLRNLA